MSEKNPVQKSFIEKIKQMIPPNFSLVDELADLLEVSTDSAYRRIRGETALSIDEVTKICNKYKISFDTFTGDSAGTVAFNYTPIKANEKNFELYLKGILADLKKIQSFEKKQIVFAAEDIPLFHYFSFPELTAFKLFYWNKSIVNAPSLQDKKFDTAHVDKTLTETAKQIIETYITIPSIEIWSEETVNVLIKQIAFFWESGVFKNKKDALTICEEFEAMIKLIRKQAEHSSKFIKEEKWAENEGNFQLYNSEVTIGNNCILVTLGDVKVTYMSHHTFNSMYTTNTEFCKDTDEWLKNLIKKSLPISGVAEKQRFQFFNKIENSLEKLKNKINE